MRLKVLVLSIIVSSRVYAESNFSPSAQELIVECPLCTPAERELRELAHTQVMAKTLGQLMQQVELLAGEPEALEALLSGVNNAVPERILSAARAIHDERPKSGTRRRDPAVVETTTAPLSMQPAIKADAQMMGLGGLVPGFAEAGSVALGIKPSAVVVSHGQSIPLNVGEFFVHNNERFELAQVVLRKDELGGIWHEIELLASDSSRHRLELK